MWLFLALAVRPSVAAADDPDNCLFCHQYRGLSRSEPGSGRVHLYFVQPEYVRARLGPHARLACTDCHNRDEVGVVPHRELTPVSCTRTCHLSDPGGVERRFSHENIAEMLDQSVHSFDVLTRLEPTTGGALAAQQARCLYCHDEPWYRDPRGAIPVLQQLDAQAFDRCDACHREQVPSDIAYYLRHVASRLQPARPTLELTQLCSVCHSDPGIMAAWEMENAVASYMRSYHGKAALLGDLSTASCLSCHVRRGSNVHQMLATDNPLSAAHAASIPDACRSVACHPGADKALAAAAVHLDLPSMRRGLEFTVAAFFIILTIGTFGPSMIIVVLELLAMVIGRKSHVDERMHALAERLLAAPDGRRRLTRFTLNQRVQHWTLALLFSVLALTGFPMKFAEEDWSRAVIRAFGGLGPARIVHHWAGLTLCAGMIMHLVYVVWTISRRRQEARARGESASWLHQFVSLPMWVGLHDGRKALHLFAYLLFLRPDRPAFGRFSVKEKFEYIGVFWGTALLGLTGVMLWGEQIVSHVLGGRVLNIALIAHTYEAFLAIIHVGILHIVNVVLAPAVFPLSLATLSGRTPAAELAENHGELVAQTARDLGIESAGGAAHG
jgi:cytochrome b subunit of formate dehydrogenase